LERLFQQEEVAARALACLRMLRSLRAVLTILSKEPLLVDTGESPPAFRPRSFADAENQVAMQTAS
jgi:hypothetical protein